jgi:iron complex transport system ATP-binding protein
MAALDIRDLSFSWPGRKLLESVSLSLRAGELAGLLGPNGSGKSTFLKNILGFLAPSGGRILYAGADGFVEIAPKTRARIFAFVPQTPGPQAAFTVAELVLMGRLPYLRDRWAGYSRDDRQAVEKVMAIMGIDSMADRIVTTLSGGELQKAVIARALVQEGEILLLDEATSGLDLNHAVEIMELMQAKTRQDGKIVLAVLHDINLAAQFCDRIVLLKNGRLQYEGRPEDVLTEETVENIYGIRAEVGRDEAGRPFVLPRRKGAHVH